MAIAFRAAANNGGNSTSYTVTVPASVATGDFMLLALSYGNAANITATPSGWTQYGSDIVNGVETVKLFTRTATSTDASSAVQFTADATSKYALGLVAYSGVTGIGEFHSNIDAGSGTSHITTALSAMSTGGSWALCIWAERSTTNTSWAAPGGLTSRVNQLGTGGGANSMLIAGTNATATSLVAETATSGFSTKAVNISLELLATSGVVAPGAPTAVSAVAGDGQATVSFTPGSTGGAPVTYTATSSPGGKTASATSSPITVPGLTNGTTYTFTVTATNSAGSNTSSASAGVTPAAQNTPFIGIIPIVGGVSTPVVSTTLKGIANSLQADQATWDNTGGIAKATVFRTYDTGSTPANYNNDGWSKVVGPTNHIVSLKPDIATTLAGGNDAAITAWAKTVPSGTYVTFQHEPENTSKGITPTQFGQFSAYCYNLVKAANANIKYGVCFMTYTMNDRPTQSQYGHVKGHNEWMDACFTAGMVPDWVGFDGYPDQPGITAVTAQAEFSPSAAVARGYWPSVDLLCCELGFLPDNTAPTPAIRSQQIVDSWNYFTSDGWKVMVYYDANAKFNYALTTAELQVMAGLS